MIWRFFKNAIATGEKGKGIGSWVLGVFLIIL